MEKFISLARQVNHGFPNKWPKTKRYILGMALANLQVHELSKLHLE